MGAQRARRTHPPHHPRLDHSAAAAGVEEPCRSDARGAAAPKLSAMAILASREAAGLLSGSALSGACAWNGYGRDGSEDHLRASFRPPQGIENGVRTAPWGKLNFAPSRRNV